jgi:LysM repeat protein
MFDISQLYGIKLDKLLTRNNLQPGQEPAVSEKIYLKSKRKKGDVPRLRDVANDPQVPNQPGIQTSTPSAPAPGTMTPDDGELLPEIGGEDPKPTQPTTPPVTPPTKPSSVPKPSTSGTTYPPDPVPGGTWTPSTPQPPVVNSTPSDNPTIPTTPVPDGYHQVVKGDTLYNISKRYNLTVTRLKQLNNMTGDEIQIGQRLRVK